jgi:hypothetical protein
MITTPASIANGRKKRKVESKADRMQTPTGVNSSENINACIVATIFRIAGERNFNRQVLSKCRKPWRFCTAVRFPAALENQQLS